MIEAAKEGNNERNDGKGFVKCARERNEAVYVDGKEMGRVEISA